MDYMSAFVNLCFSIKEDGQTDHPADDEAAVCQTEDQTGEDTPLADLAPPTGVALGSEDLISCEAALPALKNIVVAADLATHEDDTLGPAEAITVANNMEFCFLQHAFTETPSMWFGSAF
jgi:hypothetical protein